MDAIARQALNWRLRRLARGLGWPALAGLGLALLALGITLAGIQSIEPDKRARQDRTSAPPQQAARAQLALLYARLEAPQQANQVARRLHEAARGSGLALEQGEYRTLPDASGKLIRYQIVLPVNGSYPQVRRFLDQALRQMPGLALDAVSFQRVEGEAGLLRAELRFTAFLREPA